MSIFNPQKGYLFIHIPKTAGSSVESIIGGSGHVTIRDFQYILGEERFDNTFKFSIVRNPWDRFVSTYYHVVNLSGERSFEEQLDLIATLGFNDAAMYPEYVWIQNSEGVTYNIPRSYPIHHHFLPQSFFLKDKNGEINVNHAMRFEDLGAEWRYICRQIHLLYSPLPHLVKGKRPRKNYRSYYNPNTRDIIARLYKEDIERWGYEF